MSVHLDTDKTTSSINPNVSLPNNFELSPDGKTAVKYCTIANENGSKKQYAFRVYITPKNIRDSNYASLKTFTDAKVIALATQSIGLGLGVTFSGINFSYGKESQLRLKKYNGEEEIIGEKQLKAKELELDQENNEEKKASLRKTIRAFRTVEYAIADSITGKSLKSIQQNKINKADVPENIKQKLDEIDQLKKQQRILFLGRVETIKEDVKNSYKDNILVSIYYSNIYENIEKVSAEELKEFYYDLDNFKE